MIKFRTQTKMQVGQEKKATQQKKKGCGCKGKKKT